MLFLSFLIYVLLQHFVKLLLLLVGHNSLHDRSRLRIELTCLLHLHTLDVFDLGLEKIHALLYLNLALFLADILAIGLEVLP